VLCYSGIKQIILWVHFSGKPYGIRARRHCRVILACMHKIHAKSSCCRARTWQHGARRRYCSGCGRTWSSRQKRRGRKRNRCTGRALVRYFEHGVRALSPYRLRRELEYFLAHSSSQPVPNGRLIVIADAFYARVAKKRIVVYLTLVRPVNSVEAVILPPTLGDSVESYAGWRAHFDTFPAGIAERLTAAVCDGRVGLVAVVRERNLVLQRCHFHFLARLQIKRSKRPSSRNYAEGTRLYRLAKVALIPRASAHMALRKLAAEAQRAPPGLRTVLSGFVANHADYLAYRRYPSLRLPTTTGTAESLISSIRELLRRLRGVRTRTALEKWVGAYVKYCRTRRCNYQQN